MLSDSSLEELDLESLLGSDNASARHEAADTEVVDAGEIDLLEDEPYQEESVHHQASPGQAALGVASRAINGSREGSSADDTPLGEPLVDEADDVRAPAAVSAQETDSKALSKGQLSTPRKGLAARAKPPAHAREEETKVAKKEKAKKLQTKASKSAAKSSATSRSPAESSKPAAAVSARGSVAFVCSECYEEFLLPATYSQEMVCCPDCLHVGKRPDADFLRTVNRHKSGERSAMALAVGAGALGVGLTLYALWLASDMVIADSGAKSDGSMTAIFAGAAALVGFVFLWLTVRSESNRWEVYF